MSEEKKQDPKPTAEELSDEQLEQVAGGRRAMDFTGSHIVDLKFSDLDAKDAPKKP